MFELDYEIYLGILPLREQIAVRLRNKGFTYRETAKELKVSNERSRQLENKGLWRIKRFMLQEERKIR